MDTTKLSLEGLTENFKKGDILRHVDGEDESGRECYFLVLVEPSPENDDKYLMIALALYHTKRNRFGASNWVFENPTSPRSRTVDIPASSCAESAVPYYRREAHLELELSSCSDRPILGGDLTSLLVHNPELARYVRVWV